MLPPQERALFNTQYTLRQTYTNQPEHVRVQVHTIACLQGSVSVTQPVIAKRRVCATMMVARCSGFGRHAVLATSSSRLSVTPQYVCTHMSHYTKPIVGNVSNAH